MITHPFLKNNYIAFYQLLSGVSCLSEFLHRLDATAAAKNDMSFANNGFAVFGEAFLMLAGKIARRTHIANLHHVTGNPAVDMHGHYVATAHPVNIKFVNNIQTPSQKRLVVNGVKTRSDMPIIGNAQQSYGVHGELSLIISRNTIINPVCLGTVDFYPSLDLNHFTNFTFWIDFKNAI